MTALVRRLPDSRDAVQGLARDVLDFCRRELKIPLLAYELRVEFHDLGETWGEFDPKYSPKVLRLSERLLHRQDLLPRAVAHESLHASVYYHSKAGALPAWFTLDADAQETAAEAYAERIAQRWRSR
jgi:hypothetical protein